MQMFKIGDKSNGNLLFSYADYSTMPFRTFCIASCLNCSIPAVGILSLSFFADSTNSIMGAGGILRG